tara:strand:+ start:246 stop:581 length:336 start_codon:yes stop_codon:yes gene_type:complete
MKFNSDNNKNFTKIFTSSLICIIGGISIVLNVKYQKEIKHLNSDNKCLNEEINKNEENLVNMQIKLDSCWIKSYYFKTTNTATLEYPPEIDKEIEDEYNDLDLVDCTCSDH